MISPPRMGEIEPARVAAPPVRDVPPLILSGTRATRPYPVTKANFSYPTTAYIGENPALSASYRLHSRVHPPGAFLSFHFYVCDTDTACCTSDTTFGIGGMGFLLWANFRKCKVKFGRRFTMFFLRKPSLDHSEIILFYI